MALGALGILTRPFGCCRLFFRPRPSTRCISGRQHFIADSLGVNGHVGRLIRPSRQGPVVAVAAGSLTRSRPCYNQFR